MKQMYQKLCSATLKAKCPFHLTVQSFFYIYQIIIIYFLEKLA